MTAAVGDSYWGQGHSEVKSSRGEAAGSRYQQKEANMHGAAEGNHHAHSLKKPVPDGRIWDGLSVACSENKGS